MRIVMPVLQQRHIPTTSISGAVQHVRQMIELAPNQCEAASKYIKELTDVDVEFSDEIVARLTAQYITVNIVRHNGFLENQDELVQESYAKALDFKKDPSHSWMYATSERIAQEGNMQAVAEGVDVKVAVADNGKIKKGGKQILAAELYKLHVLGTTPPLTNQEFVALLMKELQMTKSGATTYAYMIKKQLGEPEGGIVKSKKGRKAKES